MTIVACTRQRWLLTVVVVLAAPWAQSAWEAPGYPGAQQVERRPASTGSFEVPLASVERIRSETRISNLVRPSGQLTQFTYEIPAGASLDAVIAHYRAALREQGETLFECRGRDCGRSNVWANHIYGLAILYGGDNEQYYTALLREGGPHGELLTAYVVQRGNRRIYAHLQHIQLQQPLVVDRRPMLLEQLQRSGQTQLLALPYDLRAELPAQSQQQLSALAEPLSSFRPGELVLVCHLYGPGTVADLQQRAQRCADQAKALLDPAGTLEINAYGVGPLAPINGRAASRLELLLPYRLGRD